MIRTVKNLTKDETSECKSKGIDSNRSKSHTMFSNRRDKYKNKHSTRKYTSYFFLYKTDYKAINSKICNIITVIMLIIYFL